MGDFVAIKLQRNGYTNLSTWSRAAATSEGYTQIYMCFCAEHIKQQHMCEHVCACKKKKKSMSSYFVFCLVFTQNKNMKIMFLDVLVAFFWWHIKYFFVQIVADEKEFLCDVENMPQALYSDLLVKERGKGAGLICTKRPAHNLESNFEWSALKSA